MGRKKEKCINHPGRLTTVRCYQGRKYICSACQNNRFHHIFCSLRCTLKFILGRSIALRYLVFAVVFLIAIQITIFVAVKGDHGKVPVQVPPEKNHTIAAAGSLSNPTALRTIQHNYLTIRIPGERAGVLAVMHNDRFVYTRMIEQEMDTEAGFYLDHGRNRFEIWLLEATGVSTCLDSFEVSFRDPDHAWLSQPVDRVDTNAFEVAFTFDAGSGVTGADSLIRILAERDLKVTFFLTGDFLRKFPALVRLLVENGQEIGNHTATHPNLTTWAENRTHQTRPGIDQAYIRNQLQVTDSLYHELTGLHLQHFWRAPFGEYNRQILEWAALAGYKHIGWSPGCDTWDWVTDTTSQLYLSGEALYEKLMRMEEAGDLKGAIVLMHLNTEREHDPLYRSLPKILDTLIDRGYKILPVSELLKAPPQV